MAARKAKMKQGFSRSHPDVRGAGSYEGGSSNKPKQPMTTRPAAETKLYQKKLRAKRYPAAEVIKKELGGADFVTLTGARNFIDGDTGTMFSCRKMRQGNTVQISLAEGLYRIEIFQYSNLRLMKLEESGLIPAKDLQKTFTKMTGLEVSL